MVLIRYLAGRLAQALFVVWAAFSITFFALRLLPGDPAALMLNGRGGGSSTSPGEIAELRARLGLDRPLVEQYFSALLGAVRGDLGSSIRTGRPVSAMMADSLPETLRLGLAALALSLLAGTLLAVLGSTVGSPALGQLLRSLPAVGISIPSFWVGLLLIQLFSLRWNLFPLLDDSGTAGLVLPACTLAVPGAALVAQVLARSLHDVLRAPYIDTIRAAGAGRVRVVVGHGLRNAAIPAVTVVGLLAGHTISGSVVVETVFSRPGIGRDIQAAVSAQDFPVVQGIVVVASLAFVVVNLLIDSIYPLIDPRIRTTGERVAG